MTEEDLLLEDLQSELVGGRSAAVKDELKRLRRVVYETHGTMAIMTEVLFYARGINHPLVGDIAQNMIIALDKEPPEFWDSRKVLTVAQLLESFAFTTPKLQVEVRMHSDDNIEYPNQWIKPGKF